MDELSKMEQEAMQGWPMLRHACSARKIVGAVLCYDWLNFSLTIARIRRTTDDLDCGAEQVYFPLAISVTKLATCTIVNSPAIA
jgi:hypothetical protein